MASRSNFLLPHSLAWLVAAGALLWSVRAHAQPLGDLIIAPMGTSELNKPLAATSMLEAELLNANVPVISLHDARDRFTARSRPPQMASDSDVDVLAKEAREAIEHVAFGRTAAAQKSVREVIARAERTLESLNRETATARQILDTCLTLVRSTLQAGKRELALEQAMRCRRLVPDLAPSEVAHPANVVGVLAEADNLLRRMRTGRLHVRSTPESSCSVYLNGRHLGTTPFQLERAAAGEYRVQVECGRTVGRVHVVQLGDEPANLVVDTQFDRAIVSDPRLLLRYERPRDAREQGVSHAAQLGREASVDDVILVAVEGDRSELMRVNVAQGRLVGRASLPWSERRGFPQPALERAIAALAEARLDGQPSLEKAPELALPEASESERPAASSQAAEAMQQSGPRIGEHSAAHEVEEAPEPEVADLPSEGASSEAAESAPLGTPGENRALRRTGYGLLVGAVGLAVIGFSYDWRAQQLRDELGELLALDMATVDADVSSEVTETNQRWERASKLRWVGIGAGALATVSAALLIKPSATVPWWSYGIAAVGVGLGAAGVQQLAVDNRCISSSVDAEGEPSPCRRRDSVPRGVLLLSAAVPLLAVPIIHFARRGAATAEVALIPRIGSPWSGLELRLRL